MNSVKKSTSYPYCIGMYFESKLLLKSDKKKKKNLKKYTPDFKVHQWSLSNKYLLLIEIHFYENARKGENNLEKSNQNSSGSNLGRIF